MQAIPNATAYKVFYDALTLEEYWKPLEITF